MEEAMTAHDASANRADTSSDRSTIALRQPAVFGPLRPTAVRNRVGMPGEMALQGPAGHLSTQSIPQELVRLIGHRDPSRAFVPPPLAKA